MMQIVDYYYSGEYEDSIDMRIMSKIQTFLSDQIID